MEKKQIQLDKRYIFCVLGLIISAIGILKIQRLGIATVPMLSISELSVADHYRIYEWKEVVAVIIVSVVMMAVQAYLMREKFKLYELLQFPAIMLIWLIGKRILAHSAYFSLINQIIKLIIGCILLGVGLFLEMRSNVVMLPDDATARAISRKFGYEFEKVKAVIDILLVIVAMIIGFFKGRYTINYILSKCILTIIVTIAAIFIAKFIQSGALKRW